MGWSGYRIVLHFRVDAHGGDKEERGEKLYAEFMAQLEKMCEDPRYAEINPMTGA